MGSGILGFAIGLANAGGLGGGYTLIIIAL